MNHTTDRLIGMDDIDAMPATRAIPERVAYTYEPVWTRDYVRKRIAEWVKIQAPPSLTYTRWIIECKEAPVAIGDVFISKDAELQGSTDLGYVIHPDFAGHGYATEAARAAMKIGFGELGVHRIFARVDEENIASVRVCQRPGRRQEARLIENDKRGDVWSTELVFAMLDREWSDLSRR